MLVLISLKNTYITLIKSMLLSISFLISNPLVLGMIGLVNRLLGRPIEMVFVTYAASEKYYKEFGFEWMRKLTYRWPLVIGLCFQDKRLGIVFGTSQSEKDFKKQESIAALQKSMHIINWLVGSKLITYGGVIPTELKKKDLVSKEYFRRRCDLVGQVVVKAAMSLEDKYRFENLPIILLGGQGSIGSSIQDILQEKNRNVIVVDRGDNFPIHLKGQQVILIDVARKGVMKKHSENFWPEMIILNETYPEPDKATQRVLNRLGTKLYHLVGIKGKIWPHFPGAYQGALPCCAMMDVEEFDPRVRRLKAQ